MTTKRNIILALIFVLAATSVLYAGRGNRRDKRDASTRGKAKPAMKDKRNAKPRAERPAKVDAARRPEKRPNGKRIVERRPVNRRPVVKPQPRRKQVKVVHVRCPQPRREIVKVVHVYHDVLPYYRPTDREVFTITILNRTSRKIDLELDGSHEGDDDIGKLHPGEGMEYPMIVKSKKLPETFELEAGPHELEFTLSHHSPRNLVLIVTPHGIYAD